MTGFSNPFRPGAGHPPPYLAGRHAERQEFLRLLRQTAIMENMVLTGLRGVGKTVLLDSFKPEAIRRGWLWVGTDLSESTSVSEETMAIRLCTDLAPVTSGVVVAVDEVRHAGFATAADTIPANTRLPGAHRHLQQHSRSGARQAQDSSRTRVGRPVEVTERSWDRLRLRRSTEPLGSVGQGTVSVVSPPRHLPVAAAQGAPLMLVLTGLPTLFPKLVEARTFAERMFRVVFLQSLNKEESEQAIRRPVEDSQCPVRLSDDSVETIVEQSGGILTSFSSFAERCTTPSCRGSTRAVRRWFRLRKSNRSSTRIFSQDGGLAQPTASAICCS